MDYTRALTDNSAPRLEIPLFLIQDKGTLGKTDTYNGYLVHKYFR